MWDISLENVFLFPAVIIYVIIFAKSETIKAPLSYNYPICGKRCAKNEAALLFPFIKVRKDNKRIKMNNKKFLRSQPQLR